MIIKKELKIDINIFRKKLIETTKNGNPKFVSRSYSLLDRTKIFYGNFDENSFHLTSNYYIFQTPTLFFIKGNYQNIDKKLIVKYQILPFLKYQNWFFRFFILLVFIFINYVLFFEIKTEPIETILAINTGFLLVCYLCFLHLNFKKKKLERRFLNLIQ
jgi:hypothetical protein